MQKNLTKERYLSPEIANQYWKECIVFLGLEYEIEHVDNGELSSYVCNLKRNGEYIEKSYGRGLGKGIGIQSRLSAQFEALEHYLSYDANLLQSTKQLFTLAELMAMNKKVPINDPEPYLYDAIGQDKKIHWLQYQSTGKENSLYLPLALSDPCYAERYFDNQINYPKIDFLSTNNGVAIGCSETEAIIHGYLELIERDALSRFLIKTYLLNKKINILNNETLSEKLKHLVKNIEKITGDTLFIYPLDSYFGIPTYGATLKSKQYIYPLSGYGASLIDEYAIERAALECLKTYSLMIPKYFKKEIITKKLHLFEKYPELKEIAASDIHLLIEKDQAVFINYQKKNDNELTHYSSSEYLSTLIQKIEKAGHEHYYHISTRFDNKVTLAKTYISNLENFYAISHHGYPALPNQDLLAYG